MTYPTREQVEAVELCSAVFQLEARIEIYSDEALQLAHDRVAGELGRTDSPELVVGFMERIASELMDRRINRDAHAQEQLEGI